MNKKVVLFASLCLLMMAFAVSAQDKAGKFMGEWTLDKSKSELGERSRVESMTMKVSKTVMEDGDLLTVTKTTKLAERQEGDRGLRGRFGRGRGGQIDGNNVETVNYDLSGKKTKNEISRGRSAGKATANIKYQNDGSMIIYQNTELDSPRGLITLKNTETWAMSADGETLTVSSEMDTPRGKRNSKIVFNKSAIRILGHSNTTSIDDPIRDNSIVPKRINDGVVNGKAKNLVVPTYPPEAKEKGVRGIVNVSVVISRNGDVIEAKAISGHNLLREVAVAAAKDSTFTPTYLEKQAVEVTGVIIYNFK